MKKLKEYSYATYCLLWAVIIIAFVAGCLLALTGEYDYVVTGAIVAGSAIVLLGDMYIAAEFFTVAVYKGYFDLKYFWISFLTTIPGYMLISALPDQQNHTENHVDSDDLPDL